MLGGKLNCPDITIGPRSTLRGLAHIKIGKNFYAGEGFWLDAVTVHHEQQFSPLIVIGNNVSISAWTHIAATHRIEIGDGTLIGSKVLISDHNHGSYETGIEAVRVRPALRMLDDNKSVVIGENVWIGDSVVVMPGVRIGAGSVIGANSVVTRDVDSLTIVAGAPARVLKRYDAATQEWSKI
jgi:lipopolysaccharide O-acetyltransferase